LGRYAEFETASAQEVLGWAIGEFGDGFAISTSFQKEGMVVIDMAARISPKVRVFTIDTERLPAETHQMIEQVRERYGIAVEVVHPDPAEVASMVSTHGANLFYRDVTSRLLCCHIRKVRPLERKVATLKAWAVGLRRSQSETRQETPKVEEISGAVKISPLADWSAADVERYISEHEVPVHPLYAKGYTSIGCDPCTRAVGAGEDERGGRWWWEQDQAKECGIHFLPDGRVGRRLDVLVHEVLSATHASLT
jgi:thioredoxin-dependent adenylylsulfate APS reductase